MGALEPIRKSSGKEVHFDELLRGLSENYGAIYYVDFDADVICPYRLNPEIEEQFGAFLRQKPTYEAAMYAYIHTMVLAADREEMFAVTRYDFLKEQLKDVLAYSHEYRVRRNGRELVFRFKISNLEGIGELHRAVMGFADVSAEKPEAFSGYQTGHKILVAARDKGDRDSLADILAAQYEVLTAEDGQEALAILDEAQEDIALVLTDIRMPIMDGTELIRQMKRIRRYSGIPIMVIADSGMYDLHGTSKSEAEYLNLGVNDFIMRPYHPQVIKNRVKGAIQLRESTNILTALEKDPLTGMYTKEFFYRRVEQQLRDFPDEDYVMWVSDIQGLKLINDKYGIEMGNEILHIQADNRDLIDGFIFGGRIEGDKLAALVFESAVPCIMERAKTSDMGIEFPVPNVVFKHGIYHIRRGSKLEPQAMYDRALLAMQKIKDTYGVNFSEYDDALRKDLLVQRQVAEEAEKALGDHQFTVYYQPKYDLHGERTNGAEALVRWTHPELGFMSPGVFIPIFEKNGFIQNVDYYVWDAVCRDIREWKEKGVQIVPISVNVSRRDFEDEHFAEKVIALLDSYGMEHRYFHIEVTESAYSDNPQMISQTVRKFHDNGFVVELDDFGTGYSSMSALSELDLDIMKLDMSLIRKDNPDSSRSVLEFSMQLAKLLQLQTVAEGVETEEQKNRIASLGGDYIQGYYYSKPLPKEQFEKHLLRENA
jgi:EAL domain-containing protein (putative c-di-GMP-specific phosphodiesterase class I)/CheY-like chemotaxis protein